LAARRRAEVEVEEPAGHRHPLEIRETRYREYRGQIGGTGWVDTRPAFRIAIRYTSTKAGFVRIGGGRIVRRANEP